MIDLNTLLIEPFAHPFMQRALLVALLVALTAAAFSCFLVLKGWSLMGDAISHAVLPGLALAAMTGLPLFIGALAAGLGCAAATTALRARCQVKEDAVMGIVFTGMFALGLVLIGKVDTDLHLMHILFGNVLGLTWEDTVPMLALSALALMLLTALRRDFFLCCFDPAYAASLGLPVKRLEFLLLLLLAVTIVAALKAAGIILVIAMLIAPGATAFLVSDHQDRMFLIALATAAFSAVFGVIASFHLDVATAPMIVVVQAVCFLLAGTLRALHPKPRTTPRKKAHAA